MPGENMNISHKKIFALTVTAVVLFMLSMLYLIFHPFVYLNGKLVGTDESELKLDYLNEQNRSCYGLQYFNKLRTLDISYGYEQEFRYMPDTDTLNDISLAFTAVNDPADIKALVNAERLHFLITRFNFDSFGSDNIKTMSFQSCCIENLDKHGCFPALEELAFYNCYFDRDDFTFGLMMDKSDDTQIITDSSAFAGLDSVKRLRFDRIIFEDISGFLDMESLEEISIYNNEISDENIALLENAGIKISKTKLQ